MNTYFYTNRTGFFALLGFLLVATFYYFDIINYAFLLGLFGSIATLYLGALKQRLENDRIFYDLFLEMNKRYDQNFNDLINELKLNNDKEINLQEKKIIIDYFNLCSEEYLWKSRGRIPNNVWKAWKSGILENLSIPQIKQIYLNEIQTQNGKDSFYGLVDELKI